MNVKRIFLLLITTGTFILTAGIFQKDTKAEITTTQDWVGLFPTGAAHGKAYTVSNPAFPDGHSWAYTSSCTQTAGTNPKPLDSIGCNIAPSSLPTTGSYEFRMYANNQETAESLIGNSITLSTDPGPGGDPDPGGDPPIPPILCPAQNLNPRVQNGLISTPNISPNFGNPLGQCVISDQASFDPYKIPGFDTLKSTYFDQSKLVASQKITFTDTQTQSNTITPINLGGTNPSLLAWWPLDGNANDSAGSYNGAPTNIIWESGKFGSAATLNGATSYIDISSSLNIFRNNNMTISLWIKANSTATAQHILWTGQSTGNGWGAEQEMHISIGKTTNSGAFSGNVINFELADTGNWQDSSSGNDLFLETPFTDTANWHHIAVVITGGTTGTLYLDGNQVDTDSSNIIAKESWNTAYIGKPGANLRFFNGLVDDVQVYNQALDGSGIQALYTGPASQNDKAYYITGDLNIDSNIGVNKTGIIFIDGNLNINTNLTHPANDTGLVFVVRNNVNINPSVTRIDAVIISSGTIYTAGANCSHSTPVINSQQLIINGSLVSLKEDKNIEFCRQLADNGQPAERINQQPKYLALLRNLFSETIQRWSELANAPEPAP